MSLDLQNDCMFSGPALPVPFVTLNLEAELNRLHLLPRVTGDEGRQLVAFWTTYRAHLRQLVSQGGSVRVRNQVFDPLTAFGLLGYSRIEAADDVQTREGRENGGTLLVAPDNSRVRFWTAALNEDLDAPARRGEAYRFSHTRIASRVLLASGERLGLLSNGSELRLLVCDPARLDSTVNIALDGAWKRSRDVPDSFRFFIALVRPEGVRAIAELIEKARLQQAKVTKDLRSQARLAVEEFIQSLLDAPDNQDAPAVFGDRAELARRLWREGLITIYRLLFILKLESTNDPAKCFSFASGSLWRNSFSPGVALAPLVRAVLDRGEHTGTMLGSGLRNLFRLLESGLECTELNVKPMGGSLFAPYATPILSTLHWPEHGVARLLDRLLWTTPRRGLASRERVHYGPLDVEDLGRVYEALLELDPGISAEPMCRLRRAKLEVVVPAAQGQRYRPSTPVTVNDEAEPQDDDEPEGEDESSGANRTKVEWIEEIPPGRFFLRVGLGRKSTGSFYTPHSFVRFLVQETLGPLVERASPRDDPQPSAVLALKVVDKAMGSGHFLVEAARFLGDALYEACRRCDDLARAATQIAERFSSEGNQEHVGAEAARATDYIRRVERLPDPDDELLRYLPSRAVEGTESGFSQQKAIALCRRLVAIHCLYGVDKNPLAVELAKLALWIECHAEGLPLTFLDHRLVVGDSLTGPFFEHLLRYPGTQQPLDDLFTRGLRERLTAGLADGLQHVRALESTIGVTVADDLAKRAAKVRLDRALAPFRLLAAAWSGGVMLGTEGCDDTDYATLARTVAETGDLPAALDERTHSLRAMLAVGLGRPDFPPCASRDEVLAQLNSPDCTPAFPYDIGFPEVFYPTGDVNDRRGFDADLGNPPWDKIMPATKEFFAAYDLSILEASTAAERDQVEERLRANPEIESAYQIYWGEFECQKRVLEQLFAWQNVEIDGQRSGSQPDLYRYFSERAIQTLGFGGLTGLVLPSAFHANEGATGVRLLYLNENALVCCYSFENKRKLFEIHSSFKFAAIIAQRGGPTSAFNCAFYLHDDEWLFSANRNPPALRYDREFVHLTGGKYWSFVELRDQPSVEVLRTCAQTAAATCEEYLERIGVNCGEELNKTRQARRFDPFPSELAAEAPPSIATGESESVVVFEGRNIWHYDDRFAWPPSFLVGFRHFGERPDLPNLTRYYRFGYRLIASSTNERTLVATMLCPGSVCTQSISIERDVRGPRSRVLLLIALWNSFTLDFLARQKVGAAVNKFLLEALPIPPVEDAAVFLAHTALRLSANHAGYEPLWREQLGEAWREAGPAWTWPALDGDATRWAVRAAVDAVVAAAYGLTREQYAHVLTTFSHTSFREAPRHCLAAFDELHRDGLDLFTRRHDPYHDIPLNECLPQPVIELPLPSANAVQEESAARQSGDLFGEQLALPPPRGRRTRGI